MSGLSEREAFDAMREFLSRHYRRAGGDELGSLLGDLELMHDGMPADEAAYAEWVECVEATRIAHVPRDAAE